MKKDKNTLLLAISCSIGFYLNNDDDDDDDNDDDDDGRKEEQSGEESGTAEEERCRGRGVVERCGPTSKPVPLPISKTTGAPRRSTSLATAAEMALS